MAKLILLRHGQSEWNKRNLFTGWIDIPLSVEGIEESLVAGRKMAHLSFDAIFVSTLVRAQMTLFLAMSVNKDIRVPCLIHEENSRLRDWAVNYSKAPEEECIPVYQAWELNERMYGELQGLNKQETMRRFGEEQVKLWRRGFDTAPPQGESLAMTTERTVPYLQERIVPCLQDGKTVLVVAHGNSIRAIIMHIEKLSKEQIVSLEIATGEPLVYQYSNGAFSKGGL